VATKTGTTLRYMHQDSLGSASNTTKTDNTTDGAERYYPYGLTRSTSGAFGTHRRFTGQFKDLSGTNLYFYNARYYDPAIGRFTSPDSLVPDPYDPRSYNRYSYVTNNPLKYTDPTGHCGETDELAGMTSNECGSWLDGFRTWEPTPQVTRPPTSVPEVTPAPQPPVLSLPQPVPTQYFGPTYGSTDLRSATLAVGSPSGSVQTPSTAAAAVSDALRLAPLGILQSTPRMAAPNVALVPGSSPLSALDVNPGDRSKPGTDNQVGDFERPVRAIIGAFLIEGGAVTIEGGVQMVRAGATMAAPPYAKAAVIVVGAGMAAIGGVAIGFGYVIGFKSNR